jgi:thioesterase domain-containing protein
LTQLKEGKNTDLLFLIHDISGDTLAYLPLAEAIGGDRPTYGINARDTTDSSLTIEGIAAGYVKAIRRVQPKGPYRLAGWSLGGLIAYEIASQLLGEDEPVEYLGLIDSYPLNSPDERQHEPDDMMLLLLPGTSDSAISSDNLHELLAMRDLECAVERCKQLKLFPQSFTRQDADRLINTRRVLYRAAVNYYPQPIGQKAYLFTASDYVNAHRARAWTNLIGNELSIKDVGGTHWSIMQPPHVQTLADAMAESLAASQGAGSQRLHPAYSPMILIQHGRTGAVPVFCVPGAGASVTSFFDMTATLGPNNHIYGLQPRGLHHAEIPYASIQTAARRYVAAIREVCPNGPYRLIGHSIGGWIVFEMALQLQQLNLPVEPLVVIDSDPPDEAGVEFKNRDRVEILSCLIDVLEQSSGLEMGITPAELESLPEERQLPTLWWCMVRSRLLTPQTTPEAVRNVVRVLSRSLMTAYTPASTFDGEIMLALAKEKLPKRPERNEQSLTDQEIIAKWQGHARKVTEVAISGNHMTVLRRPNVDEIVTQVRKLWNMEPSP